MLKTIQGEIRGIKIKKEYSSVLVIFFSFQIKDLRLKMYLIVLLCMYLTTRIGPCRSTRETRRFCRAADSSEAGLLVPEPRC